VQPEQRQPTDPTTTSTVGGFELLGGKITATARPGFTLASTVGDRTTELLGGKITATARPGFTLASTVGDRTTELLGGKITATARPGSRNPFADPLAVAKPVGRPIDTTVKPSPYATPGTAGAVAETLPASIDLAAEVSDYLADQARSLTTLRPPDEDVERDLDKGTTRTHLWLRFWITYLGTFGWLEWFVQDEWSAGLFGTVTGMAQLFWWASDHPPGQ